MVKKKFIPRPKESARVIKKRWHKKREKVELLAEKIRSLRWNISRDLKSDDEKTCLTALVIAIMDKTSERIGNDSSAANGHFGVTGFNKKHFTVIGNKVHLKYTGKSGVDHEKSFSDEKIAKALKAAIKNSPSKNVFVTSDGFQIKQDKVNRYLEDFLISAKDIRGFSCNNQVVKKLKEVTPEEKETQRKKQFLNIIRSVAKKIGHGSGTLRKHYLLPEIEPNFIEKGKVIEIDDVTKYNNGGAVVDEEKLIVKQKKKIGRPSAKKVEKKVETKKTEEKPKQKEEKVVEKTKKEPDSKVFNHLYKEHHQAWDTMQEIEDNVCEEVCDKYTKKLLSVWDSELKPHFKEEEENLFPFIIEKGNKSEVNELLDEHKELEAIIRIIQKNEKKTDKIKYFCKRLKEHIKKEEKLMSKFFEDPYKKEEKKNGGDVESTVSERFELPEAKSASDVSDNIDKICIQYAHRGMAFVQCESYLNEINKDLAKEFLKQKNISGRDGFKEYVSKRQSIVRSGKGKERSEVLRKIKEEETEKHVDNIFKMAFEQEEEMRKKIEEKKNGGDIENNYVIFFKSNLLNNIVYVKQKAKSENEAVEIVKSLYSFSEIKWIKSFPSPKEAEDGVMFFYEAVRDSFKNPFVSLELSDGKIFFSGFGNNVGFNFMPSFELKNGDKVFKEGYLKNRVTEIKVESDFKFDVQKIIDILKGEEKKNGGDIDSNEVKQKLINILSGLDEKDLWDFVYHIGNVESNYVDDIVAGYKNWINDLPKHELDMLLWRMKQPYFYQFNPKDNYSTATPVPSKFATYNDFYEKKYKKGGALNPFAICTSSIGKKEGTTKRSDWDKDAMKRYESCVLAVKEKKSEGGELTIKRKKVYEGDKLLSEMTYDEAEKYMNIFHEKKGNFMIPKNFFVAWMYDETNFSDKINSGEYDFLLFPPPIKYQTFRLGYGVVDSIWKANFQKLKGAKHLLGMVQGWYDEENKKAVVQYMSVRPSAKRNKINTFLVKGVKKFFETDEVEFDEPTKEGIAFMEGKTYLNGGQVKNFMKISNQEGEQVGVMRYETNDRERNVTIADMAALAIEAGYKVEPISESEFENAKHSFNNKLLQKFQHDVDVVSGREIKIQDPDEKKNGGDIESSEPNEDDYNDYYYGGNEDDLSGTMVHYLEENADKFEKSFPENERFILSHEEKITFRKQTEFKEELGMKPKGLWYGLGMNWIYGASRFARHLADTYEYIHKLTINESRVCILDTPEKYVEFTKKYGEKASPRIDWMFINWNKVSKDYSGIETHNPRGVVGDLGRQVEVDGNKIDTMSYFNWLLSWDVSGGCIWAEDAIKSIDLVFDWKLHKVANMKSGGGLFDENYAIAYRSIRGDWKPEYKGWQYYSSDKDYSQVWGRNTKKFKIDLSNALNLEKWNELMREAEPSDTWKHFQIGDLQIEQKYFMQLELLANRLGVERYHEFLNEFENSDVVYGKEAGSNTITYAVRNQKAVEFIGDEMANGGSISDEEKSELYSDWRELINMSASELEKFYNSEEGKEAGLSKKEADDLGIHSGRESAKWIMKMKKTPNKDWTPKMWEWAKRQISFVKRMKGNKGDLIDGKGNKTRKHLALLIWGHNPKK